MSGYALDPEVAAALADLGGRAPIASPASRGDWRTLRENGTAGMQFASTLLPNFPREFPTVRSRAWTVTTDDDAQIELRWFEATGSTPGSAVFMPMAGEWCWGAWTSTHPSWRLTSPPPGFPFLAVEYRLAPEAQGEVPVRDVLTATTWLVEHATELGVDPSRIAVMGDSAGGGLACGVALLCRDQELALARQILICPMLDDRTVVANPALTPFLSWSYDDNATGWSALLGDGDAAVDSAVAVPARATNLERVAPAYLEVGELVISHADHAPHRRHYSRIQVRSIIFDRCGSFPEGTTVPTIRTRAPGPPAFAAVVRIRPADSSSQS